MSGSECIQKITRSTLMPIGLVLGLLVVAFAFGADRQAAAGERETNATAIAQHHDQLLDLGKSVTYIEQAMIRLEVKFETAPDDTDGSP
jgi:hypothetical protein